MGELTGVEMAWLEAPADEVVETARTLLGWTLRANGVTVRLTETEAYRGEGKDPASHAHRRTPRSEVMFGPAGTAYIYQIYGMHRCLNVVCGAEGKAAAVLLRAGEVVDGLELARRRRPTARTARDLARGPGCLVQALGIGPEVNGASMIDGTLRLRPPLSPVAPGDIASGPRVGVTSAHDFPWRFWIEGDPTVTVYKRHLPRKR